MSQYFFNYINTIYILKFDSRSVMVLPTKRTFPSASLAVNCTTTTRSLRFEAIAFASSSSKASWTTQRWMRLHCSKATSTECLGWLPNCRTLWTMGRRPWTNAAHRPISIDSNLRIGKRSPSRATWKRSPKSTSRSIDRRPASQRHPETRAKADPARRIRTRWTTHRSCCRFWLRSALLFPCCFACANCDFIVI